jgi:3-deoxy-D-manno-octulosonic-acid transferase
MTRPPAPLRFYSLVTGLAEPLAPHVLKRRARRGKEDRSRLAERLGRTRLARPNRRLVWIHAASVGESLSHLPLVERFVRERSDLAVLVTSGTRTSAELLARRLPDGVIHQFAPVDGPRAVRRFLDHWRPDLGIFVESELWPNLLLSAAARGTRLVLLGARVSEKSQASWRRSPESVRALLDLFDLIYAQDLETRDWIEDHGIAVAGRLDLKRAADPLPHDPLVLHRLKETIGERKVVVAASTHAGEEILISEAVRALDPRPLLILAPRHPDRGATVALMLGARGSSVLRRSEFDIFGPRTDIYVADTLGELGLFYRLADAVVMGGSFITEGTGHNPLEPARLGRAIVSGPNVDAFAEVYADLAANRAVLIVKDEPELTRALAALIDEPKVARTLGARAKAACQEGRDAFDEAWERLQMLVPRPS